MRIAFTIPGPPEGKRRPRSRIIKAGKRQIVSIYSDPADKAREVEIRAAVREAMRGQPAIAGAVRVTIDAVFEVTPSWPRKRKEAALAALYHTSKPDSDNITKSIMDGLNPDPKAKEEWARVPFCLNDDGQVAEQMIRKRYGSPARTDVIVQTIAPPEAAG